MQYRNIARILRLL